MLAFSFIKTRMVTIIFKPTYVYNSVCEITADFLKEKGIKGLLLDLDNTLTTHNNPTPKPEILEWLHIMKDEEIKLLIVSNNNTQRVTPFAQSLDLDFIPNGKKPLTSGFTRAVKKLNLKKSEVGVVGDQIFTDILGANIKGLKSFFVFPIELEKSFWFRVKRNVERPLLPKKRAEL